MPSYRLCISFMPQRSKLAELPSGLFDRIPTGRDWITCAKSNDHRTSSRYHHPTFCPLHNFRRAALTLYSSASSGNLSTQCLSYLSHERVRPRRLQARLSVSRPHPFTSIKLVYYSIVPLQSRCQDEYANRVNCERAG
jgi:hypothetical protein